MKVAQASPIFVKGAIKEEQSEYTIQELHS